MINPSAGISFKKYMKLQFSYYSRSTRKWMKSEAFKENLFRAMPEIVIGNVIMLTIYTRSSFCNVETVNCIESAR